MEKKINYYTPELTEYSIINFSIIGKALCVATYFDKICKNFLLALVIKYPQYFKEKFKEFNNINLNSDELFSQIMNIADKINLDRCIKVLSKINTENDKFIGFFGRFDKAREARNFIAHDLCLGYPENINKANFRAELAREIKENTSEIVNCLVLMEDLILSFNKEGMLPGIDKSSLVENIVSWVLDDEI